MSKKKILLLGLSNKPNLNAFDSATNSGKIIDLIISECKNYEFTKANLVSFAPLDANNKLRYPNKKELLSGADNWSSKISEFDCAILFGKKVQDTILKDHRFSSVKYIEAVHPSYIWVYKHNEIDRYVNEIANKINSI